MAFYYRPEAIQNGEQLSWDVFCLFCGGPSTNPAKIARTEYIKTYACPTISIISDLLHLSELASHFAWLDNRVGITQGNPPITLGLYDKQRDFAYLATDCLDLVPHMHKQK